MPGARVRGSSPDYRKRLSLYKIRYLIQASGKLTKE